MSLAGTRSAALQFSKAPSAEDTKSNCAATLAWLKTSIATIYSAARTMPPHEKRPTLAREAYLHLYTATHDYCMLTKHLHKTQPNSPPNCEDLYLILHNEIRTHCSEVKAPIASSEAGTKVVSARDTVREYLAQWDRLTHLATLVTHVMQPLESEWIRRVISEGKKDIYSIKDLHTMVWKTEVLHAGVQSTEFAIEPEIAKAMATMQKQAEDGSDSDSEISKTFSESLRAIGVEPRNVR